MKILFSILFPLYLLFYNTTAVDDLSKAAPASAFDATICGTVPPLCEGQCTSIGTDLLLKINGGTPPYKISLTLNYNPSAPQPSRTHVIPDVNTTHVIRFCHDNSVTGPGGEELPGDTTIFKIPSQFFDAEILFRSMEDADLCVSTSFTGINPLPITTLNGTFIDYQADIPTHICDSLRLPAILPAGNSASYYTEPQGNGLAFAPGQVLDFDDINLPTGDLFDTLYVFDPNELCGSEVLFPFVINIGPNHILPDDISQCEPYTLLPYPGPISTPNAQYASSRNLEPGSLLNPGAVISTPQWVYLSDEITYPSGDCIFLDSFYVDIIAPPNAGIMTTYEVCVGETTIIADLLDLIDGSPDAGGTWDGTMIPDVDFNNPINTDLSHMTEGLVYVLNYTIEKPGCTFASSELVISAIAPPFAGDSTEIFLCSADGPQDMFALIGEPELGGIWDQQSGQLVAFSDLREADFRILPEDLYTFTYTLPAVGNCPQQVAELKVTLSSGPNAGNDNTAIVCIGDSIDVTTLLSSEAQLNGEFKADGFIPVPNGIWYSDGILIEQGQNSREVVIEYNIESSSINCPSDTASFIITVIEEPFAGLPISLVTAVCEGEKVILANLLDAEHSGGTFYNAATFDIMPEEWAVSSGSRSIAYIVPGSGNCKADTSFFDVESINAAEATMTLSADEVCLGDCFTLNLELDKEAEVVLKIFASNGIPGNAQEDRITRAINSYTSYQLCMYGDFGTTSNDTIFYDNLGQFYNVEIDTIIDPDGCNTRSNALLSFDLLKLWNQTKRGSVCEGETVNIDGKEYGSSVVEPYTAQNGCDSIITIVIDTFPQERGLITGSFCEGTPQTILNMTFVENTDEIVIFPGQSVFGCDSTAQVTLTFTDVAVGTLDTLICEDTFIVVEGEVFDKDRLTGAVDYAAGSVAGCDSSITVNLGFLDPGIRIIDTLLCTGDFFELEGDLYDENRTSGTTVLSTPAANNCDSIAQVMVTFQNNIREDRTYTLCEGASLTIGGTILDADNTSGVALLEGVVGCDTIANVSINFQVPETIVINDAICKDDTLEINGIIYSATNLSENSYITSSLGCDSIIYEVDLVLNDLDLDIIVTELDENMFELSYEDAPGDFSWTTDAALDCTENCSPVVTISADTEVMLSLTDLDGCLFTDSAFLDYNNIITPEPDSTLRIYFPNVLDPADTENNTFYLQTSEPIIINSLTIYDRWGNQVFINRSFMSNDKTQGWDGRRSNSELEQGVYVFYLEYDDPERGPQVELGNLTIFR